MRRACLLLAACSLLIPCFPILAADPPEATQGQRGAGVPNFTVRTGFKVTMVVDHLDVIRRDSAARFMELDANGTLYVSRPTAGAITSYKLQPDGTYARIAEVVTGKPTVHGLCIYKDELWFTTTGSVNKGKIRADGSGLDDITAVIPDDGTLPKGAAHWWRSILVDDKGFYTSIGEPVNIEAVDDAPEQVPNPRAGETDGATTQPAMIHNVYRDREKIWHFNLDGSGKELFISGIRNTEKLRHRPGTDEVWGCDHGSDNFGATLGEVTGRNQPITDMLPGDELNLYEKGKFYGHPFIVGNNIPRPEYMHRADIVDIAKKSTPPAFLFGAHWANNGWTFLTKDTLGLKGDMVVAFHGSWNDASALVGYCIQRVLFDPLTGRPIGMQRLVSCLGPNGRQVLGRPVDCVETPDGSILFSVDAPQGRIYRLSRADVAMKANAQ